MSLKDILKADLKVFYNSDEFAKECIYKDKKVSVLFAKNDMDIFDSNLERITAKADDFEDIEEGNFLKIEGKKYTIFNYSLEERGQITISLKESK
ncbi:hypothetical protein AAX26_01808 [Aliarcobacter thereius]|uniref:hypothetical protein n=1 Tax=Aliarcobacter thereius TaxID=544718 RepID=UPI000827CD7D|nr:hypothetical protein [Aliarcobacter thereius]OCL85741.1 hypothetical protein AAX26_01808 [Aliarcobacter thereius]